MHSTLNDLFLDGKSHIEVNSQGTFVLFTQFVIWIIGYNRGRKEIEEGIKRNLFFHLLFSLAFPRFSSFDLYGFLSNVLALLPLDLASFALEDFWSIILKRTVLVMDGSEEILFGQDVVGEVLVVSKVEEEGEPGVLRLPVEANSDVGQAFQNAHHREQSFPSNILRWRSSRHETRTWEFQRLCQCTH